MFEVTREVQVRGKEGRWAHLSSEKVGSYVLRETAQLEISAHIREAGELNPGVRIVAGIDCVRLEGSTMATIYWLTEKR